MGPDDVTTIARVAASLRRRAMQTSARASTTAIIDTCFPGTRVVGRRLPRGVHDVVVIDDQVWRSHRAPHVIVYRRDVPTAEQRYAIAHALGHVIFDGTGGHCGRHFDRDRERRCDRFADELLVPLTHLGRLVTAWPSSDRDAHEVYLDLVDRLASRFAVDAAVIDKRIRELPPSRQKQ